MLQHWQQRRFSVIGGSHSLERTIPSSRHHSSAHTIHTSPRSYETPPQPTECRDCPGPLPPPRQPPDLRSQTIPHPRTDPVAVAVAAAECTSRRRRVPSRHRTPQHPGSSWRSSQAHCLGRHRWRAIHSRRWCQDQHAAHSRTSSTPTAAVPPHRPDAAMPCIISEEQPHGFRFAGFDLAVLSLSG